MKSFSRAFLVLPLAALSSLAGCRSDCVVGPLSTIGLSQQETELLNDLAPWATNAKTCTESGYALIVPADGGPGGIVVTPDGTKMLYLGTRTVAIQTKAGYLATLHDLGNTGRFDSVSYDVIDPADGQKYFVTDADGVGRLNTKIGEHGGFVNIDGQWCRLEKRAEQLGAIVDGTWKPLEKQGRVWRVRLK